MDIQEGGDVLGSQGAGRGRIGIVVVRENNYNHISKREHRLGGTYVIRLTLGI